MQKIVTRRLLAVVLALIMVLALAAPAMAAEKVYATQSITVRSGHGTGYSSLGTMVKGEVATKTGTYGSWTIIDFRGEKGYVQTAYVKPYTAGDSDSAGTSTVYATGAVNVRTGPGTGYTKVGELSKGDAVQKVGATGNWTIISWGTGTAFVSSSYLTSTGSSGGSSDGAGATMIATANVNIRSGPGTNYYVIGWLAKGSTIQRTGTSGSWTKVSYNGMTAYVHSAYLSVYSGSSSPNTLLYARYETEVLTGPGSSYRVIGYLDPGQTVVYLGTSGSNWYKVQYGSNIGYVWAGDMRFTSGSDVDNAGGLVFARTSARVYKGAGTSYSSLGYLYQGESAVRTGTSGTWTRIEFKGKTGYVKTSQIAVVTGTGTYDMKDIELWSYALYSKVYCYSVPVASSSYRIGYLEKNETVWCLAGNRYWTKVLVDDNIMYVETDDLSDNFSKNSNVYSSGTRLYVIKVAGAPTYSNTAGSAYRVSGESSDYGRIQYGTRLTVKFQIGKMVCVTWVDDRDDSTGKTLTAYVDIDRVSTSRP